MTPRLGPHDNVLATPTRGPLPRFVIALARLAAVVPLASLHRAGGVLGRLALRVSPRFRDRLRENLVQAGYRDPDLLRQSSVEHGKGVLELPAVWFRPHADVAALVRRVEGEELLAAAESLGRGIVFFTPHLGCFEITAQWYARRAPLTILYRPPRKAAFAPLMLAGRSRPNLHTATTDLAGVRALLRALRAGEAIGLLPDQVPSRGEGEWASFFGRPAYTMTLGVRLAAASGAPILICYGERLERGAGYVLRFVPMPERLAGEGAGAWVNRAMQDVVRRLPAQYLWAYNRYKRPAGAEPPPATANDRDPAPASRAPGDT